MASFGLTKNTMLRLQARFQKFRQARKTVRANISSYIHDYQKFTGKRSDRVDTLEEKYMPRSPQMGWLIFRDGSRENILWQEDDIAVLMGRSQASISRVIDRMEHSPGWCSRLLAVSEETKSANNVSITAYHEGIFDLIFDKYEDEYLNRFIRPRHGNNPPDADEVMRFWKYLKESEHDADSHDEYASDLQLVNAPSQDFPDLHRLGTGDICSLILRKILTPKTGMIFTLLFAFSFELVRRCRGIMSVIFACSLSALAVCAVLLHFRKYRAALLSDIGAVAALMTAFWGLGLFSGGMIYTPGGNALVLEAERTITLDAELMKGGRVIFRVNTDKYDDLKEILYRLNPTHEYVSTGFNDYDYPDPFIEPETQEGKITIDVKYLDTEKKEHGPFTFTYDMNELRVDLSKKHFMRNDWLHVSRFAGTASVNVYLSSYAADGVAKYVVYGINTDEPDIVQKVRSGTNTIARMRNERLRYVSAYIVFTDGTSSDIRRAE